jgi:hypothetical protein
MPFLRNIVNGAGDALTNVAANKLRARDGNVLGKGNQTTVSLPGARILQDYNIITKDGVNNNLFWLHLKPKFIAPPKISTDTINAGKSVTTPEPLFLEEYKILYNDETYAQSHSHSWEKSVVQETLDRASQTINGAFGRATTTAGKEIFRSMDLLNLGSSAPSDANSTITENQRSAIGNVINSITARDQYFAASVLDYYSGSSTVPIEVKFNLIAFDNPILDIILPLKRLVSLTYPQIITLGKKQEDLSKAFVDIMSSGGDNIEETLNKYRSLYITSREETEQAQNQMLNAFSEKVHIHYGNPPLLWDLEFSNDVQFLKNAYCKSINIQYMGPWMGKPDETTAFTGLFGDLESNFGSGLFGSILNPSSVRKLLNRGDPNGKGGYPSYATVSMVFEPALSQTANDILALDSGDVTSSTIGKPSGIERAGNRVGGFIKKQANSVSKFSKNRFGHDILS